MPKRSNPFGENSVVQFKTHVREKEVNNGVCQQTRMQLVYDRTQQLLFAGMKKTVDKDLSLDANKNVVSLITKSDITDAKQMHINKNCKLVSYEGSTLMDVETDSDSFHNSLAQYSVDNNLDISSSAAKFASNNCTEILSSFGRNQDQHNSACDISASSFKPSCGVASTCDITKDVFSQMKQAQFSRTLSREAPKFHAACHNCRLPVLPQGLMRCQFCENSVCSTCVKQCSSCLLQFCQLCSVINYDLSAERSFCLNCHER